MRSILEQYSFFNHCTETRRKQILSHSTLMHIPAGTEVFTRNCIGRHMLLVGSGNIRVFSLSPVGREISLYHVTRGDTCPINILSVLLERPSPAYARAESEITAVTIPADYVRLCIKEDAAIRNFAFTAMADHLDDVIDLVERVSFYTLEQRLANFLCCQFDNDNAKARVLSVTHDQIASELGSAREVISRHLREFERQGGISLGRGHIRLNDINLLKNIYKINQH